MRVIERAIRSGQREVIREENTKVTWIDRVFRPQLLRRDDLPATPIRYGRRQRQAYIAELNSLLGKQFVVTCDDESWSEVDEGTYWYHRAWFAICW
jgi:hypothetical protein